LPEVKTKEKPTATSKGTSSDDADVSYDVAFVNNVL
jgi:hypothetical protein